MRGHDSDRGFTLIELMVTCALLGLVAMGIFSAFDSQKSFYNSNERAVEVQEDARLVLDLVASEVRMSGFMVPPRVSVSSIDGGTNGPDRFCVSDSTYFDDPVTVKAVHERFHVNNPGQVQGILGGVVTLESLDIDGTEDGDPNSEVHFSEDSGIIVSDGQETFCGRINTGGVNTAANQVTILPAHANDFPATLRFANPRELRAVPAIVYELPPGGGPGLSRNGTLLSPNIEDLQVQYAADRPTPADPGGDGDTDDQDESEIDDLNDPRGPNPMSPAEVRMVRITVVSRSSQDDTGRSMRFDQGQRPQVANRLADPNMDRFSRRVYSATVAPRNIPFTP
jgi:prepilin-type N-terminal cleavage/methylation domain-containing protein